MVTGANAPLSGRNNNASDRRAHPLIALGLSHPSRKVYEATVELDTHVGWVLVRSISLLRDVHARRDHQTARELVWAHYFDAKRFSPSCMPSYTSRRRKSPRRRLRAKTSATRGLQKSLAKRPASDTSPGWNWCVQVSELSQAAPQTRLETAPRGLGPDGLAHEMLTTV